MSSSLFAVLIGKRLSSTPSSRSIARTSPAFMYARSTSREATSLAEQT